MRSTAASSSIPCIPKSSTTTVRRPPFSTSAGAGSRFRTTERYQAHLLLRAGFLAAAVEPGFEDFDAEAPRHQLDRDLPDAILSNPEELAIGVNAPRAAGRPD